MEQKDKDTEKQTYKPVGIQFVIDAKSNKPKKKAPSTKL
jgi:hypothetical protein